MNSSIRSGTVSTTGDRVLPALAAMLLGLCFIWIIGFAPMAVVHNAAHDTRHSFAFPCH